MNTCRHVQKIRPSSNHSVLNSQKWKCVTCGSVENIWACLSCSHVACGKYLDEHIKQHFKTTKHPLSMNVWEKYVYCYDCDGYILNDNAAGDIKILRNCLQAISSQHQKQHLDFQPTQRVLSINENGPVCRRSSRVQKSSTNSIVSLLQMCPKSFAFDNNEEVAYTELWFRRYYLLAHFFNKWKMRSSNLQFHSNANETDDSDEIISEDKLGGSQNERTSGKRRRPTSLDSSCGSLNKRRKHLIPGAVGLQNLGNTCYMNSILQVLKHLSQFSKVFLEEGNASNNADKIRLVNGGLKGMPKPDNSNSSQFTELPPSYSNESYNASDTFLSPTPPSTTLDSLCDSPSSTPSATSSSPTPMSDAASAVVPESSSIIQETNDRSCKSTDPDAVTSNSDNKDVTTGKCPITNARTKSSRKKTPTKLSLSHELNSLLRIMWSGKMTMVSPHKMLYAVWNIIPFFRGYSQQDAQEFLSEFLDKVQSEMDVETSRGSAYGLRHKSSRISGVKEGESKGDQKIGEDIVTQLFQGELISQVKCLTCGYESKRREAFMDLSLEFPLRFHKKSGSNKSNNFCKLEEMLSQFMQIEKLDGKIYACEECNGVKDNSPGETVYSEAEKRFLISKLPNVLRLHLKRFMWSGRSSKGKITVNVAFPHHLDISEFCHPDVTTDSFMYSLSAVVMHHGRGFGSGHYTAYCWNNDADSWLNCNDAKMQKATLEDVQKAQAYILVYTKIPFQSADTNISHCNNENVEGGKPNGTVVTKSKIPKFADATKRLRVENLGFYSVTRTKTTIW